ncbi:MAG: winged helix DNA-binding protein [Bifidobacteriaceae bacterium]|jgi:DNA-binding MarR family transcriptional regulator|nr:winged helix DNA-binding protein [Bifidobacteriaceae bacterium]
MTTDIEAAYLKTIFQFKNLINTKFGRGKKHVLGLTDLLILRGIADEQSSVEISLDLQLTKAAVSQCTTTLEKRGLITRTTDAKNRRNLVLALTPEGEKQLKETSDDFSYAFVAFVNEMGASDLEKLLSLMRKMVSILDE